MDILETKTSAPIYNKIGVGYNHTRQADPFIADKLLDFLSPVSGETYLDIGCGTGNYTVRLAEKGYRFYGIDPSDKMLEEAKSKSNKVKWIIGSSDKIPASDEFFAGAMATLTVHHWQDLDTSLKELYRVLKKDSRLLVFTASPDQMKGYWLNHYFPQMLHASTNRMPSISTVETAANKAGFILENTEKYFVREDLKDLFLYSGKHDPDIYFKPAVRNGTSSFMALSKKNEVSAGLKQLRKDLDAGTFENVKRVYGNDSGDYLFLVFKKQ
jgi:ubiquinone/menaquinone biosynthesis C-methylase UbiE